MDEMQPGAESLVKPKTSGLAIASLILGICGFVACGIPGIVGWILGIVGLSSIKKSAGQLKGEGLAIAGIVVSTISVILVPMCILIAILTPALTSTGNQGKTAVVLANARQLSLAFRLYCDENDGRLPPADKRPPRRSSRSGDENDGRLPPADKWPELIAPYIGNSQAILSSPFDPDAGRAWAMNPNLQTLNIREAHKVVLLFECRFGSPPAGGSELLPEKPRGRRGYVFAFADYHVECVPPERLDELVWQP
jgi:hypothetical protein